VYNSQSRGYQAPSLRKFASAEEVWDHYKDKGTPAERARLRQMLDLTGCADEAEQPPARRRA
jgi:hypothetical protein